MLERTHNNVFAVEAWERFAARCDTLIGVAKLPLNKFFIAYRDPVVATQLLSSKVSFDIPSVEITFILYARSTVTFICLIQGEGDEVEVERGSRHHV
jgi:hypothetical protein